MECGILYIPMILDWRITMQLLYLLESIRSLFPDKLFSATALERFGCTQRTIVATFHNEVTAYLDRTYPDLPRSTGVKETAKFYICSLLDLKVSQGTFSFVALQIPTTP